MSTNFRIPYFTIPSTAEAIYGWLSPLFNRWAGSALLKTAFIDLPGWNMDTTGSITVAYDPSVTFKRIAGIKIEIFNDSMTQLIDASFGGGISLVYSESTSSNIIITRLLAGMFDNTNFDDDTISRGQVTIWFTT